MSVRYTLIKGFTGKKAPVYVVEPNADLSALKLNNCVVVDVPKVCRAIFPLDSFATYTNSFAYSFERKKIITSYYRWGNSFSDMLLKTNATYTTYFQGKLLTDEKVCVACPKRLEQLTLGEDDHNNCFKNCRCTVEFTNYPFTWNKAITKLVKLSHTDVSGASRRGLMFFEASPSLAIEALNMANRKGRGTKGATTRRLGKTKCAGCYFERNCIGKERNARKSIDCHTSKKALNRKLRQWSVRRFGSYENLLTKMKWQGSIVKVEEQNYWNSNNKNIIDYEVVCPINKKLYLASPKKTDDPYRSRSLSGGLVMAKDVEATPPLIMTQPTELDKRAKLLMFMMALSKFSKKGYYYHYNKPALHNHTPDDKTLKQGGYHNGYHFNNGYLISMRLKRGSICITHWNDAKSIRHLVEHFKEYGRESVIEKLIGKTVV